MDVLREGPRTTISVSAEANLTARVGAVYSDARRTSPPPPDYFFLTELVNPTQSLWRRLAPGVRRSQELANRLELGKQRHRIAGYWFSRLPEFQLAEGTLDGYYVGIPDVVGRFDFLIGGSILEFKTKPVHDVSVDDVTGRYLNDLEQLAFYSALSVEQPRDNTLCFLGGGPPHSANLRAFNVRVLNHDRLRDEIRARIELMRGKLADRDGGGLPRCPYFDDLCEFQSATCSCATATTATVGSVLRWVEITPDPAAEARLSGARSAAEVVPNVWTIRDLMLPRQRYHGHWEYEQSTDFTPYSSPPGKEAAVALLGSSIRRTGLAVDRRERDSIYERGDAEVICSRSLIRAHVPGEGPDAIPIPYIVRGSGSPSVQPRPGGYHLTELALICGRSNATAGVIALAYHDVVDSPVVVYLVRFDPARLRTFYNGAKAQVRVAIESGDPAPLPACPPAFMSSCPFAGCQCRGELGR
jgi:hypothetical protein